MVGSTLGRGFTDYLSPTSSFSSSSSTSTPSSSSSSCSKFFFVGLNHCVLFLLFHLFRE
ncbi:hypothetical protein Syun_023422 [Stephania yunnanensis]|uniref:Uncharacterized protein n=1 Tax=Stephania yunnanensis TaxID=152371 RepID=A0AAP0F9T3_9MAGN